ncbi:hypothetical protein OK074_2132 [Actinobacteria bacterium OK074]|nr:hypothetical protein OK074_2132 [Actinobacteria bacterium OK074]
MSSPPARGLFGAGGEVGLGLGVVPASAGVVREAGGRPPRRRRRPRQRGGCSLEFTTASAGAASSPPARGLFRLGDVVRDFDVVVPASAGVVPAEDRRGPSQRRRPRQRGGCSPPPCATTRPAGSSPPARGLFRDRRVALRAEPVVPASAGVVRSFARRAPPASGRPRLPGVCSVFALDTNAAFLSSPPTRDCARSVAIAVELSTLSPPTRGYSAMMDVYAWSQKLSPPARGLFGSLPMSPAHQSVVPAHAGVVRRPPGTSPTVSGRPRPRGGRPKTTSAAQQTVTIRCKVAQRLRLKAQRAGRLRNGTGPPKASPCGSSSARPAICRSNALTFSALLTVATP